MKRRRTSALRPIQAAICRNCGTGFMPTDRAYRSRSAKYCSTKCWRESKVGIQRLRTCRHCLARFTKQPNHGGSFCSRRCIFLNRGTLKTCRTCDKEFNTGNAHGTRYCSWKCYQASRPRSEPKPCGHCRKPFVKRDSATTIRTKFCSRECQRLGSSGEKSALWRGNRKAYRGITWPERSAAARERDGKVCQAIGCGKTQQQALSVDHIVPYRLVMVWQKERRDFDPNDLLNLASHCRACHTKKTHIENRLLRGDVVGFLSEMNRFIGADRVKTALDLYGFFGKSHTEVAAEMRTVPPRRVATPRRPGDPRIPRGSKHWHAKLSDAQVNEIRKRRAEPRKVLAQEFGTSACYVSSLICGRKRKLTE